MDRNEMFGEFFKRKRKELGFTLRGFCQKYGLDPGNLSRIERGLAPPPQGRKLLLQYAGFIGLKPETDEWYEFYDLAYAASGRIPKEIMDNNELTKKLPIVFRTLRGQKVPDEKLDDLIKLIKES